MFLATEFWAFSLHYYPPRKTQLLKLQDEAGCNINDILLCAFLDRAQCQLTLQQWKLMSAALTNIIHRIETQRSLRRGISDKQSVTYKEALKHELNLEREHQQCMINHINQHDSLNQGQDNLSTYADFLVLPARWRHALRQLQVDPTDFCE